MKNKVIKYISVLFSDLFNPYLIPTIGLFLILNHIPGAEFYSSKVTWALYIIFLLSTCLLPISFILILSLNRDFDRKMMNHRDRLLPYLFTAVSFFMGAQLLAKLPVPGIFRIFLLGSCIMLVLMFFITMIWKISGHSAGVGGLLGSVLGISFRYGIDLNNTVLFLILISGFVGSARIYLAKHKPAQVYAGFTLGVLLMYGIIFFL